MVQLKVLEGIMRSGYTVLTLERDVKNSQYRVTLRGAYHLTATIGVDKVIYTLKDLKTNKKVKAGTYSLDNYVLGFPEKEMRRRGLRRFKVEPLATEKFHEIGRLLILLPQQYPFHMEIDGLKFTITFPGYRTKIEYTISAIMMDSGLEMLPQRSITHKGVDYGGTDAAMRNLLEHIVFTSLTNSPFDDSWYRYATAGSRMVLGERYRRAGKEITW